MPANVGRRQRTVTAAIRRALHARDRHCRAVPATGYRAEDMADDDVEEGGEGGGASAEAHGGCGGVREPRTRYRWAGARLLA